MTLADVFSQEYEDFMRKSWDDRHNPEAIKKWGAWRWLGVYAIRPYLASLILNTFHRGLDVIDFGGAQGPLGCGSTVVDVGDHITGKPGLIFCSHMLEHTDKPINYLKYFLDKLNTNGYLILHVPSIYGYKHWSPEAYKQRHPDNPYPHKWQFILNGRKGYNLTECGDILAIDQCVSATGLEVCESLYVDDRSIMIVAKKG